MACTFGQSLRPNVLQQRPIVGLCNRAASLQCYAQKGFGKVAKPKQEEDTYGRAPGKVRRVRQKRDPNPIVQRGLQSMQIEPEEDPQEKAKREAEETEFMQRLELLKFEAKQKQLERAAAGGSTSSTDGSAVPGGTVFDAPVKAEDIYANPPSIVDTLTEQLQSDISDPALRKAKIGPGSAGLAIGAVVFGLAFVLVSGGDFATTSRYKGLRPSRGPLTEQQYAALSSRAVALEEQYNADPNDAAALEGLAVTYARLQQYDKASDLLDKLVEQKPDYMEAWRLLGEARLLQAQPGKAVVAYERARGLDQGNVQVLTGLTDSYIANSQQATAVEMLTKLRSEVVAAATSTSRTSSSSSSSSSSSEPAAAEAAAETGDAAAAANSGSSSSRGVDPVALQLLLGKTYAAWRGHDQDALSTYDALIKAVPEDFRGYLAKGVFLKERGRKGDAERMFLQAKFYAPDSMQGFVASRAGENPVLDLPDNGLE